MSELAASAGPDTVVIFAEPFTRETEDFKAVDQIVARGGRVLATGFWGGYLVPDGEPGTPGDFTFAACKLEPEGLDPLANSGEVWMVPQATWEVGNPRQRVQYSCAGQPAVVEYDYGSGHVVWWANSTPLENGSLARAANFDLLLNSLGPREGHHFYWDESLHGDVRSELELYSRADRGTDVDRPDLDLDSDRLQLQPAQWTGSRDASSCARHAHRIP